MNRICHQGFTYFFDPAACRECEGSCCKGRSGNIWVNAEEIGRIVGFLKSNQVDVIQRYLNPAGNRLSIRERSAGGQFVCIFFDNQEKKCTIYAARPDQCRRFPFWQYYRDRVEQLVDECPGVRLNQ